MDPVEIEIRGMTCDDCARHVDGALRSAGAAEASVDWRAGRAVVSAGEIDAEALDEALADTRYEVEDIRRRAPADGANGDRGPCDYDLAVIGSGSGAFAAAIRARDLGRSVLLIERGTIGGTCVNVGCIPSKALLADSEARDGRSIDLRAALARKQALVTGLRREKYLDLLDEHGIALREGDAKLIDGHRIAIAGEAVSAEAILIAAGAGPAVPPIPGLEQAGYLTSTTALELSEAPARLAVIGAGAVGLELGQMLGNFGSAVTLVELDRVAPFEEPEVSEAMRAILTDQGHAVLEGATTEEVSVSDGEKVLKGSAGGAPFELRVDEILVATSRRPNTEGLGLERIGVELDERGAIVVDAEQRTTVPSVLAAGDVTAQPQFVYVAAAGGAAAAENALGVGGERLGRDSLPRIVFTTPQIAAAGLTEEAARERGLDVEARVLPLEAVPRALVNGDTRGLVKLVAEAGTGRLLGASVLADGAGEVIQSAVYAIERGMTVAEIGSTWAPYLTMAEGLKLAAQTFTRDVAKLSCCAA